MGIRLGCLKSKRMIISMMERFMMGCLRGKEYWSISFLSIMGSL